MTLLRKLKCWLGWCNECDLFVLTPSLLEHFNKADARGWSAWVKASYDDFGAAYYLQCKHCGRVKR